MGQGTQPCLETAALLFIFELANFLHDGYVARRANVFGIIAGQSAGTGVAVKKRRLDVFEL